MEVPAAQSGSGRLEADRVQQYAPYGKACMNCAKSKTRCASSTSAGKCERCHRLNKDCEPAPIVRKKRVSKRPASSTSMNQAALEERLEGIVKMLQRSHVLVPDPAPVDGPPTSAKSTTGNRFSQTPPEVFIESFIESDTELQDYLENYRTNMVPYCPMVCISSTMTLGEMKQERPFLLLVITALCSRVFERQAALIVHIKQVLGREMLLEGTKSLDLLLGILVLAAWGHFYICFKPVNSTIIHLAMSLASDLALMRPPHREPVRVMMNYTAQGCPKPMPATSERTLEERRAAVGLYLISSIFANFFQRTEVMRWTSYLDDCLHVLEEQKDFPTDDLLVNLVRVQLIYNKGTSLTSNEGHDDGEVGVPAELYFKALKSQLDNLERSMSQELKSNVALRLHILNTTLTLHEHSLSTNCNPSSSDPAIQMKRIENLWTCFAAVKSWFNIFLDFESLPLSSYRHFSVSTLTQLGHCISALFRLSTFECPQIQWDRQKVQRDLNLGDVIKRVVDNFEQVAQMAGIEMSPRPDYDSYVRGWPPMKKPWLESMRTLLVVASFWETKVAAMNAAGAEKEGGLGLVETGTVNESGMPGSQSIDNSDIGFMDMDMLDESWIRDVLGGYELNL